MKSLLADFDILMNCAGAKNVEDIKKAHLSQSRSSTEEKSIRGRGRG